MTMTIAQFRMPIKLMNEVELLVNKGFYSSKSDVIRDAVRKLVLEKQIGSIKNIGNSVDEVRQIRKILSKKKLNLREINKL